MAKYQVSYMKITKNRERKTVYPVQNAFVQANSIMEAKNVFRASHTPSYNNATGHSVEYKINSAHKVG